MAILLEFIEFMVEGTMTLTKTLAFKFLELDKLLERLCCLQQLPLVFAEAQFDSPTVAFSAPQPDTRKTRQGKHILECGALEHQVCEARTPSRIPSCNSTSQA